MKQMERWVEYVHAIAPIWGLDPNLVMAIIWVESRGDEKARSHNNAVGLMQIMPLEAGPQFRDRPPARWLYEPRTNIFTGCRILRENIDYYNGDVWRGVAAYYAGIGNVPKDGEVVHEGAKRYLAIVKGALRRMFPLSKVL